MTKLQQLLIIALLLFLVAPSSYASDNFLQWLFTFTRTKGVEAVNDKIYAEECGSCHFAYQPGLLPAASWEKLVDAKALEDHFGDDAELDENIRQHIASYLKDNAADTSYYKRSRKIMASLDEGMAPLRITETPYIKEKHSEIPAKLIKGNPQVKSLSACAKCHRKAQQGTFDDDTVLIPGYGRW